MPPELLPLEPPLLEPELLPELPLDPLLDDDVLSGAPASVPGPASPTVESTWPPQLAARPRATIPASHLPIELIQPHETPPRTG